MKTSINSIIGELVCQEKYKFISPELITEIVKDTINLLQKEYKEKEK